MPVLASVLISAAAIAIVPGVLGLWTSGVVVAFICMTVGGFTLGVGQPMTMTMISQAVPRSWRGPRLALRLMGNRIGQVTLPIAASVVSGPRGTAGRIWFACAILGIYGAERRMYKLTGT